MLQQSERLDRAIRGLADANRRAMLEHLSDGPASASELAASFAMTLSGVLQHLKVLETSGLVRSQKHGRVRTFRIEPEGLGEVERWVARRRSTWERRLDRLGHLLDIDVGESGSDQTSTPGRDNECRSH
jgi:DNA-binding transcriptional ArsR family regulator